MFKIAILVAATCFALPASEAVAAQRGDGARPGQAAIAALRQRFDADQDGSLSEAERAAAKAAMHQHLAQAKERFDADRDGTLSESEREAARAAISAKLAAEHPRLHALADKDGDGAISRAEGEAARAWLRAHAGKRRGGAR